MPSETFVNLPAPKREAIMDAAMEEFAGHDVEAASVSKIVARLGIAKGSVYQYFRDKDDLHRYVVEAAGRALLEEVMREPAPQGSDFFDRLRWQMSRTVLAARRLRREASVMERAYRSAAFTDDARTTGGDSTVHGVWVDQVRQAQTSGEISPELDATLVAAMLTGISNQIGQWIDRELPVGGAERYDDPRVEAAFDQVVSILRTGLTIGF